MELVAGPDLSTLLEREAPLAPERAVELAMQVAAALQAAHRRGIVHRDVKPGNLLLTEEGRVKVVDFGIARAPGETSVTATGSTLGSVEYFSPEQARGEPATEASDIYALGVVLYEMLTGRRPFTGDSAYAIAVKRLSEDPPDPRAIVPGLPPALMAIVMRALRRDPAQRYRSAEGFRRALARWRAAERRRIAEPPLVAPDPVRAPIAAAAPATALLPAVPLEPPPKTANPLGAPAPNRRLSPLLGVAAAGLLLLAGAGLLGYQLLASPRQDPQVADVGGRVTSPQPRTEAAAASPSAAPPAAASTATPEATPESTPEPTIAPTPAPTPAPVAAIPAPGEPVAAAAPSDPAQSVAHWYDLVALGRFDEAYGLWSDRMRAGFERQGNLDGRWDDTAAITIHSLHVVSESEARAAVQIDFTEAKDSGSVRRFIGWWELSLVDGRWLLDWPHF